MYKLKFVWQHSIVFVVSLMAHRQSIAASTQKLPDSVVKSVSRARHGQGWCVSQNNQVIDHFEVSHWFFARNVHKK